MKTAVRLIHLYLLLTIGINLFNPSLAGELFKGGVLTYSFYSPKNYNAMAQCFGIAEDSLGIKYITNHGGVLLYDGESWELIKLPNETQAVSIAHAADGLIYVGGTNSLGYIGRDKNGKFIYNSLLSYIDEQELDFGDVWKTFSTDGKVIFQTSKWIFVWHSGRMKTLKPETKFHVSFLVDGKFYVREREKGMLVFDGNQLKLIPGGEEFADKRVYGFVGQNGQVVIASSEGGIYTGYIIGDSLNVTARTSQIDDFLDENGVYNLIVLENGYLSFGTRAGGVIITDPELNPVEILDASNILKKEFIYSQYLDDAGHLWLATDNGVTMLLLNYPLVHYNEESGIIGTVESVKQIDGVTYVVTREGLFYSNKSYSISPYFNKAGNFNLESWDIIRCRNMEPAKLLLSTTQGVFALDKDHNQTLIIDRTVKILHRGIKDPTKIYAGRNDGLSVLTYDGRWKETSLIDDLEGPVLTVSEDKEGDIWFGTIADAVVYRIQNNLEEPLVKKYDRANGLSEGSTVTAIYGEDVIIGTAKGIFKYSANNDRFILDERFNVIPDYEEIGYHRIHIGDNRIWLETILLNGNLAPGFVSITDGEFEWIVDPFKPISYDIIHAFYDGGDEGALIGGSDGLFRYHADFEKNYDRPFYTIIRKVEILGDSISYHNVASNSSTQVLPYLLNSMTFSFASVYFEGKDKILYQFKMKGYDREWSDWVKEPSRTYTNLAEGNYQFMVRSKNLYEKISTTATFNFKILPPWNRTWWFYMLGTVIVIALLWSYYTIRVTNKSLKQSQQIIAKQNYKLIDANQQLSDFAQLISHDLKAPLRGIANVATWLRKDHGESLDKKGTELMETMENRVNKMQKLISDVLEYSRQTNSKSNEETFDIGKLTRELIELNSPPDNISVQIDGTLPTVSADKVQLSIILENLISNAIKYNDKPQGRINIGTKKIRSAVFLYVKDNGPGIEARYHDKIFQMFQTLNRKDGYESTGIGLAMVKKIIDKNEGKIWIESEIGKGSTFYFSIPKVVNQ